MSASVLAAVDEATGTIITQVDGLKQLVNEFSRFAKMPESSPVPSDLNAITEEVIGLYRPAHPEISFDVRLDDSIPTVEVDPEQIKRVLVNLIDNAVHVCKKQPQGQVGVNSEYDPHRQLARVVVSALWVAVRSRGPLILTEVPGSMMAVVVLTTTPTASEGATPAVSPLAPVLAVTLVV